MAISKGTVVRQVVPIISGTVVDFSVDRETGKVQLLVEWQCDEGHTHSKFFFEEELEVVA